ncbi:hypothetical protein MFIFM68171_02457 [Madurella fahalii]|uniref:Proteophosphoglycan ppg4 n=1 Tax=Madurella fahalii TaxID=1157608 RepID=A0ABQ0G398_9PEZI
MGNAQSTPTSTEPPRRPSQKLSKPKTGNHATAGLLSPSTLSNSPRRLSNAQLPNPPPQSPTVVPAPTTVSPIEALADLERRVESGPPLDPTSGAQKESKRRRLFRSRSSRATTGTVRRNHSVGPGSRLVDRLSRTSSMTYESAVAYYGQSSPDNRPEQLDSRTSWNYNLTSYEAKRLLNLTEELPLEHATAMSENKMTVVTETTWKSSNPAHPPSATITRASSDVSLYMPVRRQSIIQTPGVATRSSSARDLPALPTLNFRHSHPATPSLSRQQSFESYRSGIVSMPPRIQNPDAVPRVMTPCEEQYQSIGAFKLGSLRITNGSPSPLTPDVGMGRGHGRAAVGDVSGQDDYFAEPQARDNDVAAVAAAGPPMQSPRPHAVQSRPPNALFVNQVAESNASGSGSVPKSPDAVPEFLSEISFSPLLSPDPSQPASPLKTTSKVTALEDQLFDDEPQPEYSSVEVLDVRLDPNAKPPHPKVEPDAGKAVFTRTDSGFISTSSPSSETHKPLTKADSGYSSIVSLRSFQTKAQGPESQLVPSLEKRLSQSNERGAQVGSASSQAGGHYPVAPEREAPPPPVPPKDTPQHAVISPPKPSVIPSERVSTHNSAKNNHSSTAGMPKAARHIPNPIISHGPGDRGLAPPGSMPRTPGSAGSVRSDKSSSALSIGSGSQKPGRLQRLLSGTRRPAAGPPTVHATHALEQNSIPSVPREVENRLQEHTGLFPTTVKRLAVKSRSSLDTLKTIFSVGSIEASLEAVSSMQAANTVRESETKEGLWKQTLQSVPASIANAAAHVIPRKSISRKPVPVRQESVEEWTVTRLGREPLLVDAGVVHGSSIRRADSAHAVDTQAVGRATKPSGRTMSLTLPGERGMGLSSAGVLPSPPIPSPVAKAMSMDSKSMTPASATPRRPLSLRVPPPLRSESSTSSLRRKASRESIQSYPAAQPLSRKGSRETISSHYSNQQGTASGSGHSSPGGITMDPRRLMSFRQFHARQSSLQRSPNWEVQTDHGMAHLVSQTSTPGGSRRNSMSSVQSFDGYGVQRPSSAQGWQIQTVQQPLRHRASYDGYSHRQWQPRYGYPPSMSNGYTAPSKAVYDPRARGQLDAASTWSRSQLDAAVGQWYQNGAYPPYVPRGHYRNRSMGNRHAYGPNPPYRVLHSYNSPAYRNAPIWG